MKFPAHSPTSPLPPKHFFPKIPRFPKMRLKPSPPGYKYRGGRFSSSTVPVHRSTLLRGTPSGEKSRNVAVTVTTTALALSKTAAMSPPPKTSQNRAKSPRQKGRIIATDENQMDTDKTKEVAGCELRVASKAILFTRNAQHATRNFLNSSVSIGLHLWQKMHFLRDL
jgi:hypothetical protein